MLFLIKSYRRLHWAYPIPNWNNAGKFVETIEEKNDQPNADYNPEFANIEDQAGFDIGGSGIANSNTPSKGTGNEEFDELIETLGYSYDPEQDIFVSRMHPWQRKFVYCRLFDELATVMGMVVDCEPIYFDYNGQKWMIGIWKGQYDMVTGGEIGFYKGIFNINLPGINSGIYYRSVNDDELLPMAFTLKKNGKVLFTRKGKHWWLTGFKLGEFSNPSELSMDISIEFPNEEMRDAFIQGLKEAGYENLDINIEQNLVSFTFDKPRTPQPLSRTRITDWIIQRKNKFLCDEFNRITGEQGTIQDKIRAIEEQSPEIYDKLLTIGSKKPSKEMWGIAIIIAIIVLFLLSDIYSPKIMRK